MSLHNYDDRYLLSKVVWVKAEATNRGKKNFILVPFLIYKDNTIAKNILNNINYVRKESTSMMEYLSQICKREYNAEKIFEIIKPVEFRDPDGFAPHIFQVYLPNSFNRKHEKEYLETGDMTVTTTEIRALSKYLSKKEQQTYLEIQAEALRNQR